MLETLRGRLHAYWSRLRRLERREVRDFRRWIEHTSNLLHLTVLVVVPLLIGLITYLSNEFTPVYFLLYPPLASGTYTLFADPDGKYSSARTFVGGMTLGALSGWISLEVSILAFGSIPQGVFQVHASSAALAIFLTGIVTWAFDLEEPTAFSTALLILLIGGQGNQRLAYVLGVAASSMVVAAVFYVWRERFYKERARYLYRSTSGDDHVLVPMRDDAAHRDETAMFGATLAADHEAGMVVLLDVVDDAATAEAERALLRELEERVDPAVTEGQDVVPATAVETDGGTPREDAHAEDETDTDQDGVDHDLRSVLTPEGVPEDVELEEIVETLGSGAIAEEADPDVLTDEVDADELAALAEERAVAESATELEGIAVEIEERRGIPCEVVVAVADDGGWSASIVERTVRETGCDLVVSPYDADQDRLREFTRGLFGLSEDVIAFRSTGERTTWGRAMVPVRRAGDVANAMIDFARRVTGDSGRVSVCNCIGSERQRRTAETMLSNLVEAFPGDFETRVSHSDIEEFLATNAPHYDVVFLGASTDRTAASRLFSPPTFERLTDVETDVAIVHRGR